MKVKKKYKSKPVHIGTFMSGDMHVGSINNVDKIVEVKIESLIDKKHELDIQIAELKLKKAKVMHELHKLINMKNKSRREMIGKLMRGHSL